MPQTPFSWGNWKWTQNKSKGSTWVISKWTGPDLWKERNVPLSEFSTKDRGRVTVEDCMMNGCSEPFSLERESLHHQSQPRQLLTTASTSLNWHFTWARSIQPSPVLKSELPDVYVAFKGRILVISNLPCVSNKTKIKKNKCECLVTSLISFHHHPLHCLHSLSYAICFHFLFISPGIIFVRHQSNCACTSPCCCILCTSTKLLHKPHLIQQNASCSSRKKTQACGVKDRAKEKGIRQLFFYVNTSVN